MQTAILYVGLSEAKQKCFNGLIKRQRSDKLTQRRSCFLTRSPTCNAVGMMRKLQRPTLEQLDNLLTGKDKEGKQHFLTHLTTRLPAVP